MLIYVVRRLLASIPVVLLATLVVFCMVSATFDPTAKLAHSRDAAHARAEMREDLGLDRPLLVQYEDWLTHALRGDFGKSYRTGESVAGMVRPAIGATAQLVVWGLLISLVAAVAIGVFSAVRQYSIPDYALTALAFVGLAMPPFWFGLLSQQFAVNLRGWFGAHDPILYFVGLHSAGKGGLDLDYLRHLVLPVLTLTIQIVAAWSRYQRASMLDVLSSDYIRTARAKGVPWRKVVVRHGLRNALIPLVTVVAIDAGVMVGGLVVTEHIFSVPGMGRLFVTGLLNGDSPVVLSWLLVSAVFVIVLNLVADLLYSVLDPRIRLA